MRGNIRYYLLAVILLLLATLGYLMLTRLETPRNWVTRVAQIFHRETTVLPSASPSPSPSLEPAVEEKPKWVGTLGRTPGGRCTPAEIRGEALSQLAFNPDQWAKVMNHFHAGKKGLLAWLDAHRGQISAQTYSVMKERVSELKIQRPPIVQDPDLSWRGIGVYAVDSKKGEMIRIGTGILELAERDAKRSKFELTRLIALSWAPCDLLRVGVNENVWAPLLKCLQMAEQQICTEGSFSEAGWAVATLIASAVSPPGCRMPILDKEEFGACMKQVGGAKAKAEGKDE